MYFIYSCIYSNAFILHSYAKLSYTHVINVLSAREQPLQNLLLFDGDKSVAPVYPLHPFFPPEVENVLPAVTPATVNAIPVHPGPATGPAQ